MVGIGRTLPTVILGIFIKNVGWCSVTRIRIDWHFIFSLKSGF